MPAMRQLEQTEFSAYGGWITLGTVGFTILFILAVVGAVLILGATGEGHLLQPWRKPFAGMSLLVWAGFVFVSVWLLVMVAVSIKLIRCRMAYGDSTLTVMHYPDATSNRFCARVTTGVVAARQRRFTIRLRETHMNSSGRDVFEHEVWSRTLLLDPRHVTVERGRSSPWSSDLSDVPEPPEDTRREKTVWGVEVRAAGPGPEYHAYFSLTPTGSPFVRFG